MRNLSNFQIYKMKQVKLNNKENIHEGCAKQIFQI